MKLWELRNCNSYSNSYRKRILIEAGVPLALLGAFVLKLPVYWGVALSTTEELSKFVIELKRLKSNKWIRNITV
ncbi:hypothetical protein LAV44_15460 [Clostridium sporogenes]|uniref:hypothetical protein n=1 Tax=Clostridium sporogenes TaxID=1509 RepID=UPI0022372DC4|nr:hypothetical protein [Clostridium sporogenes]MCW6076699.1 hypothetical protein [Clostridium sporogenes]